MANILHVDASVVVREAISKAAQMLGHSVVSLASVPDTDQHFENIDLYICDGEIGVYFDGLLYALEQAENGNKVLILAQRRKFFLLPFLNKDSIRNTDLVQKVITEALLAQ